MAHGPTPRLQIALDHLITPEILDSYDFQKPYEHIYEDNVTITKNIHSISIFQIDSWVCSLLAVDFLSFR